MKHRDLINTKNRITSRVTLIYIPIPGADSECKKGVN